ncbi:LysM peptidoglycan-binding domain-containing protein [Planctomycetota bacterium]
MTSDTKVGLLLGLVFIFVIAFLINGLPSFRTSYSGNNELTEDMRRIGTQSPGLAAPERNVERGMRSHPVAQTVQQPSVYYAGQPYASGMNEAPRTAMALPFNQGVSQANIHEVFHTVPETHAINTAQYITQTLRERFAQEPAPRIKTYEVSEGDSLASIAKYVYGPEEGNRKKNIDRIFEANRKTLSSPDRIRVGQKLIIPPLEGNVQPGLSPQAPVRATPATKPQKQIEKPLQQNVWYVVKEGESLWKIAQTRLGNGNRYQEIIRLNADLLSNEDNLSVGDRLRLPLN